MTTHYNKLCYKLDKNVSKNYHMEIKKNKNNDDFKFTYKIKKGISKIKGGLKVLRDLGDEFTTSDIINVFSIRGYVEKTARNHLRDMCSTKVVKRIGHGKYKKALKIFDSEA